MNVLYINYVYIYYLHIYIYYIYTYIYIYIYINDFRSLHYSNYFSLDLLLFLQRLLVYSI